MSDIHFPPPPACVHMLWPYAGWYFSIERDCEWKNGRIACDRQMTLDVVG